MDHFYRADRELGLSLEQIKAALLKSLEGKSPRHALIIPPDFTRFHSNAGYITMAYHLGLVSGTSATTFSPTRAASREQVAVILMRLYDKLQDLPGTLAIVSSAEELPCVSVAAIPAVQLVSSKLTNTMLPEDAAALRESARQAGIPALLYVPASRQSLNDVNLSTENLLAAVAAGDYDGLFLDMTKLTAKNGRALIQLITKVNAGLGDKTLYLTADAPVQSKKVSAYDYAQLTKLVDRLFLRIEPYRETVSGFVIAPPAPPEDIYRTLTSLKSSAESGKLALKFSTAPSTWSKTRERPMTDDEIRQLLDNEVTAIHYSDRYACSYFISPLAKNQIFSGWYLEEDTLNARLQLAALLGTDLVCLTP